MLMYRLFLVVLCILQICPGLRAVAQSQVHRIAGVSILPDRSVRLELQGNAAASQSRYFDLFPVERSVDLVGWKALGLATRTNALPGMAFLLDANDGRAPRAFYRTPTNVMVSPLPPLSGPYAVGSFSRLLTDFSRTNASRRTNHQFMITIFYPAIAPAGVLPERYWEPAMIPDMEKSYASTPDPNWISRDYRDAPLAAPPSAWPVLLYSPSLNSERRENLYKLLELASHGFVVAACDHRETFASAFPNGSIVRGKPVNFESPEAIYNALADRVADVQFMLGELTRLNNDDPLWTGRLDLFRTGAFGFSFGGITAAQLCRTDSRIRAGAGMDGVFFVREMLESPLPKPFCSCARTKQILSCRTDAQTTG